MTDTATVLVEDLEAFHPKAYQNGVLLSNELWERILAMLKRPLVEWATEYYSVQKVQLPLQIRDRVLGLLADLSEEEQAAICAVWNLETVGFEALVFDVDDEDSGYLFTGVPHFLIGDLEVEWHDVVDPLETRVVQPDLYDFSGELSDVFAPVSANSELRIDLRTGVATIDPE